MPGVAGHRLSDLRDRLELLRSIAGDFVPLLAHFSRGPQKDPAETTGEHQSAVLFRILSFLLVLLFPFSPLFGCSRCKLEFPSMESRVE